MHWYLCLHHPCVSGGLVFTNYVTACQENLEMLGDFTTAGGVSGNFTATWRVVTLYRDPRKTSVVPSTESWPLVCLDVSVI